VLNRKMKEAARKINLKTHLVAGIELDGPGDIEVISRNIKEVSCWRYSV
jgi:hypothetical protein